MIRCKTLITLTMMTLLINHHPLLERFYCLVLLKRMSPIRYTTFIISLHGFSLLSRFKWKIIIFFLNRFYWFIALKFKKKEKMMLNLTPHYKNCYILHLSDTIVRFSTVIQTYLWVTRNHINYRSVVYRLFYSIKSASVLIVDENRPHALILAFVVFLFGYVEYFL